ncbi:MAG TPA: ABC transporter ATP-binding protein [Casimicrobiaceae bacterium]
MIESQAIEQQAIELQAVSKSFGDVKAIDELSLSIGRGEFVVILGSSGSGKSTLLRMMNRLVEHDSGRILFAGEEIRSFRPEDLRRRMGYAIQSIGLFPHWTVERNIATVPSLLKWPKPRIEARVAELMSLLQLEPAIYSTRYPHQLSGGQQQRVGVARALAADPEVLLMDEPFGALDPVTRAALQRELARIHEASGKTIVLVTHDVDEALALATRIVLLDKGRIVQSGTPLEMLAQPADDSVIAFFGRTDVGIRLLGLRRVGEYMRRANGYTRHGVDEDMRHDSSAAGSVPENGDGEEPIPESLTLRDALSMFVSRGVDSLPVADGEGRLVGRLELRDLIRPPHSMESR